MNNNPLLSITAALVISAPLPVSAGGFERSFSCNAALSRRAATGRALGAVAFPFRTLGCAFYHLFRTPGQLAEKLAFGETGEEVAAPVAIAPAPPSAATRALRKSQAADGGTVSAR